MSYKTMRDQIEKMMENNYEDFVKALISKETGVNDLTALDKIYNAYMELDHMTLINDDFKGAVSMLRERGEIKDIPYETKQEDTINIVGNVIGNVEQVDRETKNGEPFTVVNFSVVAKDDEGNKIYHKCSAYGDKGDIPKDFKQGDFVKIFGQVRTSQDDKGVVHANIRVLSSKLLKAKEQMKSNEEKKDSVLGAIKKYKEEDKAKPKEKTETKKKTKSNKKEVEI